MSQKKVLKMNLFPSEYDRITSKNVCKLQRHLLQIVPNPLSKIVTNRMWVGLQQYRNLGHMEEVNDLIQYQAEIDLSTTESSFSFLNLLIWAHPIVGFLGTVVGIGAAIGGFSSIVESAVEINAIKGALQVVTGGLSTAFDTTLIGLVFAMILMFTTTPLKKMEEDFLADVENFTIRELLNRMRKKTDDIEEEEEELDEGARIRKIIQETFQLQLMGLQSAFQTWQGGFSSVINQIGEETQALGQQFSSVTPIVTDFREVMNQFSGQVQDTARQQEGMLEQMGAHVEKLTPVIGSFQQAVEGIDTQRQMISDQLATWVGNFDKLGEGISEKFTQMGERVSEGIQQSGSGVISEMEKHLTEQNTSLAKMNGEVTKEISKMSSELIGKLESHVSVFEKFQKGQAENISAQSKNLDALSSSITGEFTKMCETILSKLEGQVAGFQKFSDQYSDYMTNLMGGVSKEVTGLTEKILQQFQDQLSGWLSGFINEQADSFSKLSGVIGKDIGSVSDGMISKLDSQLSGWIQNLNKELSGNIGDVSASVAKEISGMGESVIKNLEQSSRGLIDEMAKVIDGQGSSIEKVLRGFEDVNKSASASSVEIVGKFESLSQLLSSLTDKQGELVGVFNSGIKTIKPELQNLATNISKATKKPS
jgi:ABC-type transporter Mla subunit MlaD